jgi:hypothetical protein
MTEDFNEYLWDKSGTVDSEIEALEKELGEFHYSETEPVFLASMPARPAAWSGRARMFVVRFRGLRIAAWAAVAAIVLITAGGLMRHRLAWNENQPWSVTNLSGSPRIEGAKNYPDRLAVGQTLSTDASSSAEIRIGNIGSMRVEPNSEVRLLQTAAGRHRVALEHGTIEARTWAPPFSFAIQTASSTLFDLGCAFKLHVDNDGGGLVQVESGWVQFEYGDQQTIVPAGAEAITRPNLGPGTAYFPDASAGFKAALNQLDFAPAGSSRADLAIETVVREARARDAISLLSLLHKVDRPQRERLLNALERFVPIPSGATREQVLNLDPAVMDRYWRELGLGNPKSWLLHWRDVL